MFYEEVLFQDPVFRTPVFFGQLFCWPFCCSSLLAFFSGLSVVHLCWMFFAGFLVGLSAVLFAGIFCVVGLPCCHFVGLCVVCRLFWLLFSPSGLTGLSSLFWAWAGTVLVHAWGQATGAAPCCYCCSYDPVLRGTRGGSLNGRDAGGSSFPRSRMGGASVKKK